MMIRRHAPLVVSKTCDWWDELYGYSDGVCDYYGMNIEDEMGCDYRMCMQFGVLQ